MCIVTDRVRSTREGYVLTRVCPSIHPSVCPHLGGGGTPARSRQREYPSQVQVEGTPTGGYPTSGTPHQTWPGGTRPGGYPTSGTPPVRPGQGGTLTGGTPPQVPPVRPGWGVP